MAETLSTISLIAYIISAVFFVLAIVLFIVFKIPAVIGDLSGKNARKSIERIRLNNVRTGDKSYRSSKTNIERGKLTETISASDKSNSHINNIANINNVIQGAFSFGNEDGTVALNSNSEYATTALFTGVSEETTALEDNSEAETTQLNTSVNDKDDLTNLSYSNDDKYATEPLNNEEETTQLNVNDIYKHDIANNIKMLDEIILINSDEVIV